MSRETEKILWQTVCNGKSFACHAVTNDKISGKTLISMGFGLGSLPVWDCSLQNIELFLVMSTSSSVNLFRFLYFSPLLLSVIIFLNFIYLPHSPCLLPSPWPESCPDLQLKMKLKCSGFKQTNGFYCARVVAWSLANPHWPLCVPDIVHSWTSYGLLQFNYGVFQYTTQHGVYSDELVVF